MSASTTRQMTAAEMPLIHSCPACGSAAASARRAWRFINARGETEWLRCPECQSYFMDGEYDLQNEISHTEQMTWGDSEKGEQLNDYKQRMYRAVLSKVSSLIDPHGSTLLDVGCSYGGFMEAASEVGFNVFGFDIVPQAVAHVNSVGMQAQCCAEVKDFTLSNQNFDVISVLDANIYWPNQPQQLAEIFQRLRPGGLLVMRVVDKSWMATAGAAIQRLLPANGQKILRRAVNDHRFSMPVGSFLTLLERTGFRIISASPKGAVHSDQTSFPVRMSFAMGTALWHASGIFLAPGAVVIAERPRS